MLPTSPRRLKLREATSDKPGGYVGQDFGELSRAAVFVLEKWGWSDGVLEYCANLELHPASAGFGAAFRLTDETGMQDRALMFSYNAREVL